MYHCQLFVINSILAIIYYNYINSILAIIYLNEQVLNKQVYNMLAIILNFSCEIYSSKSFIKDKITVDFQSFRIIIIISILVVASFKSFFLYVKKKNK